MQPVLEIRTPDDFTRWPTGTPGPCGFLVLDGTLTPEEVGTAVWLLADTNDVDPDEGEERGPRPDDPLGAFLHGLLTLEHLFAPGGFRVTDSTTGAVFEPGCCNGLEDWREWLDVLDGSVDTWFGHDPSAQATRVGSVARLTPDPDAADGPVIELPVDELRRLLAGAERDLRDFVRLAGGWAERQLPGHAAAVTAALTRALALEPAP
ncbi:hypothetical protein [Streptomyces sp. CBMA123]|uniref:hypothetical protein n=1 Tax=Streptomyces sp. CBMA123 TaxID=1896313 RepID=UPI001CB7C339|nr:hypothetical protein [Streptomyces sp. CBMA123]